MLYKEDGTQFRFVKELFYVPKERILVVRTLGEIHIDTGYELTEYFKRNRLMEESTYGFTRPIWYLLHEFVSIHTLMLFITNSYEESVHTEVFKELLRFYKSDLKSNRLFGIEMLEEGYKRYTDLLGQPTEYATF